MTCIFLHARIVFIAIIACARALSADIPQPDPDPVPAETAEIAVAGTIELGRLVDLAAHRLGINIDYDAAALKAPGPATIRIPAGIANAELWVLVNRVLATRGFSTIRVPGPDAYSVVKLQEAAALATPMSLPERGTTGTDRFPAGYQSVLYRARFRPGRELAEAVGKMLSKPGGSAATLGEAGSIIVISDLAPRVEQALRLIDALDAESEPVGIEEVRLVSLTGQQMVALVSQVTGRRDGPIPGSAPAGVGGAATAPPAAPGGGGSFTGSATAGGTPSPEVIVGPDPATVLIIATPARSAALRKLIGDLDSRPRAESITYTPRHFSPQDVAKLVEQSVRIGGATSAPLDERFRIVIDDLTGSLIITGTPAQHAVIRTLLDRLDSVPASARRPMRTFVIRNRPIDEVVSILTALLDSGLPDDSHGPGGPGAGQSGTQATPAPPALAPISSAPTLIALPPPPTPPPPAASFSDPRPSAASEAVSGSSRAHDSGDAPVYFTIDKGTSTLIAVGEPRILDQIAALLKTLDVRQPQVMLEVLLVTLTDGQTIDLGVELEKLQVSGGTLIRLSSLFGLGLRGAGGDRDGPPNASGFTGVVLNPGDFSIVLRALETINHGRAVSMPRLLVGNNEEATLDSVVQQPFASVNASNTVSTTSFGGTQDAGTVVTIQPQIAEGDHLLLQYSVSLSAFLGPAASATLPPPRQQNRVQSVATIPDGFTVVVGGIEIENKSKSVSQIPFLGSIPILGEAFKSRNNADSRSTFYVFIRANVLRHGGFEDLKHLSETDVARAGVDDGWPELKPRVIR